MDLKLTNNILIVKIELDNYGNTSRVTSMFSNSKIKSIPTAKFKIHNCSFKVQSAIFFNNTIVLGEHRVMVRNKKNSWFFIYNENIEKKPWLTNSKNAHILVFEEIKDQCIINLM